ncbi:MAG: hypothetical protein Q8R42_08010, partial [Desulfocapsaceae bacterium]|nr:hypothetical protein [Desulfocapsaceae bacterium]
HTGTKTSRIGQDNLFQHSLQQGEKEKLTVNNIQSQNERNRWEREPASLFTGDMAFFLFPSSSFSG